MLQDLIEGHESLIGIQSNMLALQEEYNTRVEATKDLKRDPKNRNLATKKMYEGRALFVSIIDLSDIQQRTKEYI